MQDVSFFQAMIITVVSMVVVFLVLILISYLIGILKNFSTKNNRQTVDSETLIEAKEIEEEVKEDLDIKNKFVDEDENEEKLVAVIAAAIAANMGLDIPHIKINKIRRTNSKVWNDAARLEQTN